MIEYVGLGMKTNRALELTGLTKHQLYYKPSSKNRPGAKPSIQTVKSVGSKQELISNDTIVEVMRKKPRRPRFALWLSANDSPFKVIWL